MNKVKAVVFGVMMSAAITANAANQTTTVTGEVGKDVKLSLESNPTTGYGWMIKDLPDGLIFVSGGYEQSKDCPKGAVGCGGEEVLHFIGEKKGESTLKLIYGRSFDKSSWQEKEVKVVIK
ncbi:MULTISPECIES: protease inhibitor I42 family protein [Enterobacteriaceae]|uniref:protease inhibitor I42 family protein n=1 Tax=Enterobacteriaceae TaxID=543 RepID=UPI00069E2DA9|nr:MULTISPECIES: protease inhibitor I42 family protein [Enterobacteriaceae]MBE4816620.1 protease inhibitor I42 family protein [Enterobacter cloacae complex sp. P41C]MBE4849796.1 protease inhibitor I42 family protein [Enterobacter cloacae complex sp. P41RS]MBZ7490677.1 protease inhibitor I42 family protein [Klebsiella michiganensis]HBM3161054.1 protease inhibitor I42 family protein [Klebsiella michiganensis]HCU2191331.1 protease inhibitor I42 family protein [Klebsiella variicola]